MRASLCGDATGDLLAVEVPLPVIGVVEAGEQVEERRLAGAVRSDQGGDLVALDLDVVDVDGDETAELPAHRVGDEDRVGLGDAGLASGGPLVRTSATSSADIEHLLAAVAEDALRPEDDEQGEDEAGDDELDLAEVVGGRRASRAACRCASPG